MSGRPEFDVFLSFRTLDAALAEFAVEHLERAGLTVLPEGLATPLSGPPPEELRSTLAESAAVVLLVTPGNVGSSDLAFLAGAAMAWDKPVYVLFDGIEESRISPFLRQFRVAPVTASRAVAEEIRQGQEPLTPEQQELLKHLYADAGVPTDQLLVKPQARAALGRAFAERAGVAVGAERLVRELLNLRKRGQLPRLNVPSLAG